MSDVVTLKPAQSVEAVNAAARIGVALRARRKALGISMMAAAEAAGMSRVTWHRLEKGESNVAWGSLLAAARALGLTLQVVDETGTSDASPPAPSLADWLPLHISLAQFPGLRRLAWQVGEAVDTLTPHEAYGLYERNARHLDRDSLSDDELALWRGLRQLYAEAGQSV